MKNEELNTKVYEKAFTEQEKFRRWLLSQPPKGILGHAYEYALREDILLSLEYDPSQRANGFLTLVGGVIITFAKEILNLIAG